MTPQLKLAGKLRLAMTEKEMTPAQLARLMGVKGPSVYDWLKYGRIAKDRLQRLSEVFGKPLSWWLGDDEEPVDPLERQLLALYRELSDDFKERLLSDANKLHVYEHPSASPANPFPNAPPPGDQKKAGKKE